jgi:hypothetical protein
MGRFHLRIALALLALALVATCGVAFAADGDAPPDATPHPGDLQSARSTDVFHLHTVWEFEDTTGEYDEWFSPGSGLFDFTIERDNGTPIHLSNDGTRAFVLEREGVRRVEGSREYLKAVSAPSINLRAGAALLYAYLAYGKQDALPNHIENGQLVITDDSWQPQENNKSKVRFEVTVEDRISEQEALDRHLFQSAKTTDLRRLRKVGERPTIRDLHAWWLGRTFREMRAVTAYEEKTAHPERNEPKRKYTTVYAAPAKDTAPPKDPREWPDWPDWSKLDNDPIILESMPRSTRIGYDNEPEIREPVWLADGTKATLIHIGPLEWIRTRNALVTLDSGGPSLESLAGSLRPVPKKKA